MSLHEAPAWPRKTREMHNHHMDSTRWNGFAFRDGDVVIATWGKSGTTWMQQIVGQLLLGGDEDRPTMDLCPWVDLRIAPKDEVLAMLEGQEHRRFMKTHLPVDALVFSPRAKYIYIARDGRDALWSWYNHHASLNDWAYQAFNETPGRVGWPLERPTEDMVAYFNAWLEADGYPIWPFFSNVRSWWEVRDLPNVMLMHFNDLKADLEGGIRRVADFLEVEVDSERRPSIVERCTFDYMKAHADRLTPMLDQVFKEGGKSFIYKGTNGRWRDVLSAEDIRRYEQAAERELGAECARWLAGEI